MYAQIDDEGQPFLLLKEIEDHRKDEMAVTKDNTFVTSANGNQVPRRTMKGWELLVHWRDGETCWVPLKELKASNPVELAEYAVANRIEDEPAFNWWVSHTLRKQNRIISKVKSRYWRTTHKFGVKLPKSVEEALEIDRLTGTDLWAKAINKEMSRVKVAWKKYEENITPEQVRKKKPPGVNGYQEIGCHTVFDVKMDFTCKAQFVAGGHTTKAPASMTYSSVVYCESVRLGFLIAALNDVDLLSCDLENAYLNAPCKEKIWFEGGLEAENALACWME